MTNAKILATVKFNQGVAYVFENRVDFTYYKDGNYIWGTNGILYECYKYERPSGGFFAFGGRKFNITLNTGEVIKCYGQWWSGGEDVISEKLRLKLKPITYGYINELKKCYCYIGGCADENIINEIINENKDVPHYQNYYDYEKIIKWDSQWEKIFKIQKEKELIIKEAKRHSDNYKKIILNKNAN